MSGTWEPLGPPTIHHRLLTADEWAAIKDHWRRHDCPAHGPLDENGGCAGCVAEDRATDAWEGN